MGATRKDLIRGLWPDKALYGSTLLFLTAILGVIHGAAVTALDPTVSDEGSIPTFIKNYPPEAVLVFSLIAGVLAYIALRRQSVGLAATGCLAGILSFGLLGLGTVLSLVAGIFVVLSRAEGEHANPDTAVLDALAWPDKALAASVVITITGVITLGWGLMLLTDSISLNFSDSAVQMLGLVSLAAGLLCLVSAYLLYGQRGFWLGVVSCVAAIAVFGLYVVGPLLAVVTLVLLVQAHKEEEFRQPAAA